MTPGYRPNRLVLSHRARKELRTLGPVDAAICLRLLQRLAEGRLDTGIKALQGQKGYLRARLGPMRLIWAWQARSSDAGTIRILRVARRHEGTYGPVFEGTIPDEALFDIPDPQEDPAIELAQQALGLAYRWDPELQAELQQFLRFDYVRSPELRPEQDNVFRQWLALPSPEPLYLQSAPGTGKTTCALHWAEAAVEELSWRVELLVPQALLADLAELPMVQRLCQPGGVGGLQMRTWREWLAETGQRAFAHIRLANRAEELAALTRARATALSSNELQRMALPSVEYRDVLLLQGHILSDVSERDASARALDAERLASLTKLQKFWTREIGPQAAPSGLYSRLDMAKHLRREMAAVPAPPRRGKALLIIVDEAQELLNEERLALEELVAHWDCADYPVRLMLLGDLNQRLDPTGFRWPMRKTPGLAYNFRNSQQVAALTLACYELADAASSGSRKLPPAAHIHPDCEEMGAVFYHVLPDGTDLPELSDWLSQTTQRIDARRQVLIHGSTALIEDQAEGAYLRTLTFEQAKGREFNACVFTNLFAGEQTPAERFFAWYTMLSRPRVALLVALTPSDMRQLDELAQRFQQPNPITTLAQHLASGDDVVREFLRVYRNDIDLRQSSAELRAALAALARDGRLDEDDFRRVWMLGGWDEASLHELTAAWRTQPEAAWAAVSAVAGTDTEAQVQRAVLLEAAGASWAAFGELKALNNFADLPWATGWVQRLADNLERENLPMYAQAVRHWAGDRSRALPAGLQPGQNPMDVIYRRLVNLTTRVHT